jgi:hypothetical protein
MPIVNQPQVDGWNGLDDRGHRWIFEALGHLKPGVTPAQATNDLNSIGAYLEKTYPGWSVTRNFPWRDRAVRKFHGPRVRGFVGD